MKRAVAVIIAALSLSASAPQDKGGAILWAKTWKDGLDEARIRNVPILFTGHKDG